MSFLTYLIHKLFFKYSLVPIGGALFVLYAIVSCDSSDNVSPSQNQTFIKLYGGNGSEEGKDLVILPDGGFVIVGSTTSESNGGKDVYVVRTDYSGNAIWENRYGGARDDVGNSVILSQNGSIYVCGEITQDSSANGNYRDVYVLNLNLNDGSLIGEEKIYGEEIRDEFGTDIIELSNGGFFITSTMLHPDTSKYYLIETTAGLDTIQNRSRYIGTNQVNNYSTKSFESVISSQNPFVCFGTVQRTVNGQESFWFRSFLYRSDGDATTFPEFYGTENTNEFCTDVHRTTDGGYVVVGYTNSGGINNEMVIKINPNRQINWQYNFPNEFGRDISSSSVLQTLDGGFIVASTIELDNPKNDEISLLKLNSEGDEEWRKTYGSNDDDVGSKVMQLEDGSFILVGTIGFEINPDARSKMCLMKINPNGDLIPLN